MRVFAANNTADRAVLHAFLTLRVEKMIPTFVKVEDTLHDYSGSRTSPASVASRVLHYINNPGPQPKDILLGSWDCAIEHHYHERAEAEREYELKLAS